MKRTVFYILIASTAAALGYVTRSSSTDSDAGAVGQMVGTTDTSTREAAKPVSRSRGAGSAPELVSRLRGQAPPPYDPIRVMRENQMPARELFAEEVRDPAFAAPRESFLGTRIESLLGEKYPDAVIEVLECKTLSCQIEISTPRNDDSYRHDLYLFLQRPVFGQVVGPKMTASGVTLSIVYSPEMRDQEAFEDWFEQTLAERDVNNEERWQEFYRNAK